MSDQLILADEALVLERLRAGDEAVFEELVTAFHPLMLRLALMYVADTQATEEVIQETWIGVLKGLDRFEGRSSLKTWIFSILMNRAKTLGQREGKYISMNLSDDEAAEPSVSEDRFIPMGAHSVWGNHWSTRPSNWNELPEDHLVSEETLQVVRDAVAVLPPGPRHVITLRDLEGWGSEEVCNVLGLSETNQRVLLHRARSKVRQALEDYLG